MEEKIHFTLDIEDIFMFVLQCDLLTEGSLDWAHKLFKQNKVRDFHWKADTGFINTKVQDLPGMP